MSSHCYRYFYTSHELTVTDCLSVNHSLYRGRALKMQNLKLTDQCAGHEIAGHANAKQKTSSDAANVWVWIDWVVFCAYSCSDSRMVDDTFKCDFFDFVSPCVASSKKLVLCIIFIAVRLRFFYINITLQTVHYSVCDWENNNNKQLHTW